MTKFILLTEWARKNQIPLQKAKDMARKGRLRGVAKKREVKIVRWMMPEDYV